MRSLIAAALLCFASHTAAQTIRSPGGDPLGLNLINAYGYRWIGFAIPKGFEATTIDEAFGINTTSLGTASAVTFAATAYGKYPRVRYTSSATTANSSVKFETTAYTGGRGQYRADNTEFVTFMQIGFPTGFIAGHRGFVGALAGTYSASSEPSTFVNAIYFGFDSNQSNWQICANGAAGTATCVDLGVPISQTGMFHFDIRYDGAYRYRMKRLDAAGIDLKGTVPNDLPNSTTSLRTVSGFSIGAAAAGTAVIMEPKFLYLETP